MNTAANSTKSSASEIPNGFVSVSRDEFFRVIGPQNVTPYPRGRYPYISEWRTPAGVQRGWSSESVYALPDGALR